MSRFVDLTDPKPVDPLLEKMRNTRIPWGPIGEAVYRRTYSQDMENGRKEHWPDTILRAVDGNLSLVPPQFIEPGEREKLCELLITFGGIPAGRHLNASGMKGRQFLFNCHASGWDYEQPSAHFTFLFDALMQGGGVGSNYSNRYMHQMPVVKNCLDLHIICRPDHPNIAEFEKVLSTEYQREETFSETAWQESEGRQIGVAPSMLEGVSVFRVSDDREGWTAAVEHIIDSAFAGELKTSRVIIDVSPIRSRGKPLKRSGGIACGPGPLVTTLWDMTAHLNGCEGRRLGSLDAMVIDHTLSACVVAGGKRRSSRMAIKNWQDDDIFEFVHCKRQDGSHWTTNISVEVDDGFFEAYNNAESPAHDWARRVMREVVTGKRKNGEPGFWNRSLSMKGEREPEEMYCPNPCGEIGLQMWENCNLGHVNLGAMVRKPVKEVEEAFRLMTRWLMRATFGDVPSPRQRKVLNKNRRIGVGFFGYHEWIALHGIKYSESWNNEFVISRLKRFQERVNHEAYRYAQMLDIPVPVKTTTLAPTGTIVNMPGTTGSGQAMMAPWFRRLVRYSSMDPELSVKRLEGYEVYADEDAKNTDIVVFWCEDPLVAKVRAAGWNPEEVLEGQYDVPFEASLKVQTMFQEVWANNAISFTINLSQATMPSEEEMEMALIQALPKLKGTTVFPPMTRKNTPIQPISKSEWDAYQGRKEMTQVEDECKGACPVK